MTATTESSREPFRILVLCTGNSARSQIAEALLKHKGGGRVEAVSAGSHPAPRVNPYAVEVLREVGIPWEGHVPRGIAGLEQEPWDLVITVCDRARESCPYFPGAKAMLHWGLPDPAEVEGDEERKRAAFRKTRAALDRWIDRLLALPLEHSGFALGERELQQLSNLPEEELK